MNTKPYAAFGTIIYKVTLEPSETIEVKLDDPNGVYTDGFYFYTDGSAKVTDKETNEILENRSAGWLSILNQNSGISKPGTVIVESINGTEWICIPKNKNLTKFPESVEPIILNSGESKTIPNNTNLLLCAGNVTINNKGFTDLAQIRIRSGDTVITANSLSYLLIFP